MVVEVESMFVVLWMMMCDPLSKYHTYLLCIYVRVTFLLFAKALLAVARQLKKIGFFFLCPNPTPPAVCNPNYRGIACNPNYRGGKLKAASWVAAKRTPHPTRLHRGSNPDPPFCSVPPLPLRQHSPRNYCFHKYINPKYLSLTLMVFG